MGKFVWNEVKGCFGCTRFVVLTVSTLYLAFVQASLFAFNTAYVEMADRTTSPLYGEYLEVEMNNWLSNATDSAQENTVDSSFDWAPSSLALSKQRYYLSAIQKSFAFAGSFAGSCFGTFPMLYLLRRVGARITMFIVGTLCSLLCALTPASIAFSFGLFVAVRFSSGFVTAPLFSIMGAIIEDWGAMEEKGLFVSCLTGSIEIAMLFSLPVGALIAEKISWPATFYIHAQICAFFTVLLLRRSRHHPWVSFAEETKIKQGKRSDVLQTVNPSFRSVLSSTAVWAVFIAAMGIYFVGQFIINFSPQYFTSVLGYSTTVSGTLIIIPTIALIPVKFITGVISDRLTMLSEVAKMRLFNSLASFGAAAVLIIAIFVRPSEYDIVATALIMIPFILFGFMTGGFHKSAVMISREHAPFVYSLMHIFDMLALLASTFGTPLLTPDNTFDQWRIVFIIFVAVLILSNVVFTIFVKAEPEEWAQVKVETTQLAQEDFATHRRQSAIW